MFLVKLKKVSHYYMSKIKKHSFLIYFSILLVISAVSITYILNTATPTINVSSLYEDISQFNFSSNVAVDTLLIEDSSSKATFSWDKIDAPFYITSFDGGVASPPSNEFSEIACIPDGTKRLQLDISIRGKYNTDSENFYNIILYLATYDENGQVQVKSLEPDFQNQRERARNFTLSLDVDEHDKFYKILIRISPNNTVCQDSYIEISKLDVIYK